jgi:hypothetical protein
LHQATDFTRLTGTHSFTIEIDHWRYLSAGATNPYLIRFPKLLASNGLGKQL